MYEDFKYSFKIIFVGDESVGKTSIINSFVEKNLNKLQESTIGIEYHRKIVQHNDDMIKAQIYDTSGQENYQSFTRSYYRNATGVVIVYDMSNKKSFQNIKYWYNEVEQYCQKQVVLLLVGNKSDLEDERQVSFDEGFDLAETMGAWFVESSSIAKDNITLIFEILNKDIYEKIQTNEIISFEECGIKLGQKNVNSINQQMGQRKNYPCC